MSPSPWSPGRAASALKLRSISLALHHSYHDRTFTELGLTFQLDRLAVEFQLSSCVSLPRAGVTDTCCSSWLLFSPWILRRIELSSLYTSKNHFTGLSLQEIGGVFFFLRSDYIAIFEMVQYQYTCEEC